MNANDFPTEFLNEQEARRAQPDSRSFGSIRGSELLLEDEVYMIVGCAIEVLNELGHGLHEKPYENALVVEFAARGIHHFQQPRYDVLYKRIKVGEYVPDLVAFNSVVVDAKIIERITDHERGQMLNYLKITGFTVGIILNFKRAKPEWERIVLERARNRAPTTANEGQ